ncbi:hypothetical protein ZEAMMB73_Zm00001d051859 [Zea mays]|uniref:Uncharacterized protein n=1 Tax=Zea mays TaxID=4577 RepID=B6UD32_MAIZE|nr:hypothetical protein [Zea mays]AQK55297.1 hypothetical protein ZEAMMB73_Zm00001d051859 [Zea mays]
MFFRRHLLSCFLLLLLLSRLPSSIVLGFRTSRGEEGKSELMRRHDEHEFPPAVSPSKEVDAASKFTVSRRMVPQGPNPLHNR